MLNYQVLVSVRLLFFILMCKSTFCFHVLKETLDIGEDSEGDGSALTSDNPLQSVCCRRKRRKARKSTYTVVNPDGNIYYYWLMLLSICVLYNLWTIILRQTFPELEVNIYANLDSRHELYILKTSGATLPHIHSQISF